MKSVLSKKITVFTPTYNRAYILSKLYDSMRNQTNKDFEWIIVDDGSTDNTKELIDEWRKEGELNIEYFFQENSGKHIAHNKAVLNCNTPWIMCVDSDDLLTEDAIEVTERIINEIQDDFSVIGIIGPKGNLKGERIYKNWPGIKYGKFYDVFEKYGFSGEIVWTIRTDIAREYLFPQIEGENFVPENVLYRRINKIGRFRFYEKIIYCFEYKNDGYTKNALSVVMHNPNSYMLSLEYNIKESMSLKVRAKAYAYREIVRILIKPNSENSHKIVIDFRTRMLSLIYMPHYYLKIKRGIKKYL